MSTFSCARAHLGQQAPSQGLRMRGGWGCPTARPCKAMACSEPPCAGLVQACSCAVPGHACPGPPLGLLGPAPKQNLARPNQVWRSSLSCVWARAHLGQQAPSKGLRRQGGLGLPHSQALQGHGLLGAPLCRFGAGLQLGLARPCLTWATPWTAGHSPKERPGQAQPSLASPAAKPGQA